MKVTTDIDFVQMAKDVACIKQAVMGNGQPGLCQRIENLEESEKKQGRIIGVCSGISAIIGGVISHLINHFRGQL